MTTCMFEARISIAYLFFEAGTSAVAGTFFGENVFLTKLEKRLNQRIFLKRLLQAAFSCFSILRIFS